MFEKREIPGFPGYYATPTGQIWSGKRKIFLAQRPDKDGYLRVNLSVGGRLYTRFVHRLVALAYIPLVSGKEQIDHIDRDKTNNNVSNLRWVTA